MKSALRATAILGCSSAVTIASGLISSKAYALLVGPTGMGLMGLLQSLLGLAGLVAGMGVGTGLVRLGAHALDRGDPGQLAALQRGAWIILWSLGGVVALVMVVCSGQLSTLMFGGSEYAAAAILMAPALLFSLAQGIQTGVLNAHHKVEALARVAVFASIVSTAAGVLVVLLFRTRGIPFAVLFGPAAGWLTSFVLLRRSVPRAPQAAGLSDIVSGIRALLRFGAPYTLSMLVGFGVQLALPFLVLRLLGQENVGYYQAALKIAVGYLGFVLTAMAQDYYPRVSGAASRPAELVELVNQQHRLVMLIGGPVILGALTFSPYLVPLVYSKAFTPAVDILEWLLIGDILKFSSWTMSYVVLARCSSATYFLTELVWGSIVFVASWAGIQWLGLSGLGIAYLTSYGVYYLMVRWIVHRDIGLTWTASNKWLLVGLLGAALSIRMLTGTDLEYVRTPWAVVITILTAAGCLRMVRRELASKE